MKVIIDGVEYNVYTNEDFLTVQKVLTGSYISMMSDRTMEIVQERCREKILEEYWADAKHDNDVQREIIESVIDINPIYDGIIRFLSNNKYSCYVDIDYEIEQMKETLENVCSLAEDIESQASDYC